MLARKSMLTLSTDILKALFGFASTFFTARYLGATALGTLGYLVGLGGTLALVSDLGMHQAFRKCASENPEDNGGYVAAFIMAKTVLGLLLFGACVCAPVVYPHLGVQLAVADIRGAYWIIVAYYLLNNFLTIPVLTFQARRETAKLALPGTIGSLVSSCAKIVMALAGVDLTTLAIAYALEMAVGLVVGLVLFWRYPLRKPTRAEIAHLARYAWPMVLVTMVAYILPNVDRILVENSWGAGEVGFYAPVFGIVALMQRVPLAAMAVFFSHASEDAAKGDLREIQRRVFVIERYLLMIIVPMSVGVALGSAHIVRLYLGEGFERSALILAVLAFNPLLVAFFEPYNTVVYAIEKHRYLVLGSLAGLAMLLVVDAFLVPRSLLGVTMLGLGGLGAALGGLASQAVIGAFQFYLARRYAGVGFYWRAAKFAVAGLSMAVVASLIQQSVPPTMWATAIAVVIGFAAYLATLALLREFAPPDARLFLDLLHPGKMMAYVLVELRKPAEDKGRGTDAT